MSVDVSQETNLINTAINGKDVRGSLANGITKIADEVNSFEGDIDNRQNSVETRQTNLENTFTAEIENAISENPSSAETVGSRTDNVNNITYDTLGARLDNQASQLADIAIIPIIAVNTDITDIINNIINNLANGGKIKIPNGEYWIDASKGITPKDNITIELAENTVLKVIPNSLGRYALLKLGSDTANIKNFKMYGGTLIGDRYAHMDINGNVWKQWAANTSYVVGDIVYADHIGYKCIANGTSGTTAPTHTNGTAIDGTVTWEFYVDNVGEWGYGIGFYNVEDCTIENVKSKDFWGDGFCVGKIAIDVKMKSCIADNNRRQGLSITGVDGFYAENCNFMNSNGTAPQYGVDIEPEWNCVCKNVHFKNCTGIGNAGNGFGIVLAKCASMPDNKISITFDNCKTKLNTCGFFCGNFPDNIKGTIEFLNCKVEYEKVYGFQESSCSATGVHTHYENCTGYNCNTNNYVSYPNNAFGSSFHINADSNNPKESIGNVTYSNCKSVDDRFPIMIRNGFSITTKDSTALKNIKQLSCYSIGYTNYPRLIYEPIENIIIRDDVKFKSPFTSSGTVSINHLNHECSNKGAGSAVTLALITAQEGYVFCFRVEESYNLTIQPQATSQILSITTSAGVSIRSANKGNYIELRGRSDGNWDIIQMIGTWTVV